MKKIRLTFVAVTIFTLLFLNLPAQEIKPILQIRIENSFQKKMNNFLSYSLHEFYNHPILSLWVLKSYHKFIYGFGSCYVVTGFDNYVDLVNLRGNYYFTSRLGIGVKLEIPLSTLPLSKFEVAADFESYRIELENEKGLHIAPSIGINLFYLHAFNPGVYTYKNISYNNNINPTLLIQPYIMFAFKNKNTEFISLTIKCALGIVHAEKLTLQKDQFQPETIEIYTNNSYFDIGFSKNIDIYGKPNSYPRRKMQGKYDGKCPKY